MRPIHSTEIEITYVTHGHKKNHLNYQTHMSAFKKVVNHNPDQLRSLWKFKMNPKNGHKMAEMRHIHSISPLT